MQRMTKAALATGAAAVLLLGGAGTMAYWTGSAEATAPAPLQSGTFAASGSNCTPWQYTSDDGGGAVTAIVPGDTVTTTCTFTLDATGDHVALGGATVQNPVWTAPTDPLPTALGNASVGTITVTPSGGGAVSTATPDPTTGQFPGGALAVPTGATIKVPINVTFPYGSTADNTTMSVAADPANNISATVIQAALQNITVQLIQGHLTPTS